MYRNITVAVVIPAYNEEKLIEKTVNNLPDFIDHVLIVNDASTDDTAEKIAGLLKHSKKIKVITNKVNLGVGGSLIAGFEFALSKTNSEAIGIVAGDAQFDTDFLKPMLDEFIDNECDYVKASRFYDLDALRMMPKYRQVGNVVISLLTKFSTGYYTITDVTNGCGFLRRSILEKVNFKLVQPRYDYETSMLTALSLAGAHVKDHPVPAFYGEETSTIKLLPTVLRNLRAVWVGFWRRIYYKYILYSFHPIALFLLSGLTLCAIGFFYGLFLLFERIFSHLSPSTGTVMLVVLPFILGFQLLLTAIIMDVNNEGR